MQRLGTLLSRAELWLAVGFSAILGLVLSICVDSLIAHGSDVASIATASIILSFVILASSLAARNLSTDFGICVVAWEANQPFKERTPLIRGMRSAARGWEPFELDLPASPVGAMDWIHGSMSAVLTACEAGLRAPIGRPRLALVPATRDHYAFVLGSSLRGRLAGVTTEVWGRRRTSKNHESVQWRPMFRVGSAELASMFAVSDADGIWVGTERDVLRGILVLSARRLPSEYRNASGQPDPGRYLKDHREGYLSILVDGNSRVHPDSQDLVVAARFLRSYSRAYSNAHGGGPVPLRLLCGEAEAFALGLLTAQLCEFKIEIWAPGAGWQPWITTGGEGWTGIC